jgi:hypothetical protein
LLGLARIHDMLNDPESAIAYYKKVLVLDASCVEAIACLGAHFFYTDQVRNYYVCPPNEVLTSDMVLHVAGDVDSVLPTTAADGREQHGGVEQPGPVLLLLGAVRHGAGLLRPRAQPGRRRGHGGCLVCSPR